MDTSALVVDDGVMKELASVPLHVHVVVSLVFAVPHIAQLLMNLQHVDSKMVWGDPAKLLWIPLGYVAALLMYVSMRKLLSDNAHIARQWLLLPCGFAIVAYCVSWIGTENLPNDIRTGATEISNVPYPTDFRGRAYGELCESYVRIRDSARSRPQAREEYLKCVKGYLTDGSLSVPDYPVGYLANSGGFGVAGFLFGLTIMRLLLFLADKKISNLKPDVVILTILCYVCWVHILYPVSSHFVQMRSWATTIRDGTFYVPSLVIIAALFSELYIKHRDNAKAIKKALLAVLGAAASTGGALFINQVPSFLAFIFAAALVVIFIVTVKTGLALFPTAKSQNMTPPGDGA